MATFDLNSLWLLIPNALNHLFIFLKDKIWTQFHKPLSTFYFPESEEKDFHIKISSISSFKEKRHSLAMTRTFKLTQNSEIIFLLTEEGCRFFFKTENSTKYLIKISIISEFWNESFLPHFLWSRKCSGGELGPAIRTGCM